MSGDDAHTSPDATGNWQFKPGDTITADTTQVQPQQQPTPTPVASEPMPAPVTNFDEPASRKIEDELVTWTASEFIAHQKNVGWYGILALVAVALCGIVFLITRDKITVGMIVFAAIIFGIYAARKPRTLQYQLDFRGLTVGNKFFDYGQFRSFSVIDDGAFSSVMFMPLKRFMPALTIYYDPSDEPKIVKLLSERLPMENRGHDLTERFLRRIRF